MAVSLDDQECVWTALECFLHSGDPEAAQYLEGVATTSVVPEQPGQSAAHWSAWLATRLLQRAVQRGSRPSVLLLVAIMNKFLCTQVLPKLIAAVDPVPPPLPSGSGATSAAPLFSSDHLVQFYLSFMSHSAAVTGPMMSVDSQLAVCVAALQLHHRASEEDVVALLQRQVPPSQKPYAYVLVFSALMAQLSDRRARIGPIRRSRQRLAIQRHMHHLLDANSDSSPQMATLLARVTAQGAHFLRESTTAPPLEVAPAFLPALVSSTLWEWCRMQVRYHADAPDECQELVCAAIGCITDLASGAAVTLVQSGLECALLSSSLSAVSKCRVLACVFETSLESVVLDLDAHHPLQALVADGVRALLEALSNPATHDELLVETCVSLGVLAQVLSPTPIPPLEDGDDVEDYEMVIGSFREENASKLSVLQVLGPWLSDCLWWLANRLLSQAQQGQLEKLGERLRARLAAGDDDEGHGLNYEEVSVALYDVYCRLRILGVQAMQPSEAASAAVAAGASPYFSVELWCSPLLSSFSVTAVQDALFHSSEELLLAQSALAPYVVEKYIVGCPRDSLPHQPVGETALPRVEFERVILRFAAALKKAVELGLWSACGHYCEALLVCGGPIGADALGLAWKAVCSMGSSASMRASRWNAVKLLGHLLEVDVTVRDAALPIGDIVQLHPLEQLELLATRADSPGELRYIFELLMHLERECARAESPSREVVALPVARSEVESACARAASRLAGVAARVVARGRELACTFQEAYLSLVAQLVSLCPTSLGLVLRLLGPVSSAAVEVLVAAAKALVRSEDGILNVAPNELKLLFGSPLPPPLADHLANEAAPISRTGHRWINALSDVQQRLAWPSSYMLCVADSDFVLHMCEEGLGSASPSIDPRDRGAQIRWLVRGAAVVVLTRCTTLEGPDLREFVARGWQLFGAAGTAVKHCAPPFGVSSAGARTGVTVGAAEAEMEVDGVDAILTDTIADLAAMGWSLCATGVAHVDELPPWAKACRNSADKYEIRSILRGFLSL